MSALAVILFTVRDFIKTPAAMVQTFKKVKAIGYDHVELGELGPIDPKELKKLVDAEELSICASHVELSRLQNELNAVIEEHHIWECKNVVISALPKEYQNEDGYKRFARKGSEIGRRLKEQGITLSYHNHWWELEKIDSWTGLEILFEESDPCKMTRGLVTFVNKSLFLAPFQRCFKALECAIFDRFSRLIFGPSGSFKIDVFFSTFEGVFQRAFRGRFRPFLKADLRAFW